MTGTGSVQMYHAFVGFIKSDGLADMAFDGTVVVKLDVVCRLIYFEFQSIGKSEYCLLVFVVFGNL